MTTRRIVLAGAAALIGTARAGGAAIGGAAVSCAAGRFVGERMGTVSAFRGIRYGRAERFRAPVAEPPMRDPQRAMAFGPACPQRGKRRPQSEDCLFLNVWTVDADPRARLPVLVWIHGGAYAFGSAADEVTHGEALAARGQAVVVSVNHRLNALGYLYLARLDPRLPDSGNAGQLDLVLALRWVRDNIAAFGGDPSSVTLIGQSGGGAKIATLMGMPAARGLFHRAVTLSGQQVTVAGPMRATARARAVLARLDVREPRALATMPVDRLLDALAAPDPFDRGSVDMGPVLDGTSLTRHPFWPDADPNGLGVDLMLGGTRDETRDFFDPASPEMRRLDWAGLPDRLATELPLDAPPETIVAAYRRHWPDASPAEIFYRATTDGRSWRPQMVEAEARARAGRPAHVYQLDFPSPTRPDRRAFHGLDIALFFGTLDAADAGTGTGPAARALSRLMQDRLLAFAATGSPTPPGMEPWPAYTLDQRATMVFDARSRVERDPRRWQRELFAPYPYTQPGT